MVGNYKYCNWIFGVFFIYVSGCFYIVLIGFYEVILFDGSIVSFFEVSDKNVFCLLVYYWFDLLSIYEFDLVCFKVSFGFFIYNVYGWKNLWYKEYDVVEGELLEINVLFFGFMLSFFFNWLFC